MTWIVQHGLVLAGEPSEFPYRYAAPLFDCPAVGPQHLDWRTERLLRHAHGVTWSDLDRIDEHAALLDEDLVLLSQQPELNDVVAAFWWIDVMTQRGFDLSSVRLAIRKRRATAAQEIDAVQKAAPIGDDLEPLLALRHAIAADTDDLILPIEGVSDARRGWASIAERIRDFLPDSRGLDVYDARALDAIAADWTRGVTVISDAVHRTDPHHAILDRLLWERVEALASDEPASDPRAARDDDAPASALVELEYDGRWHFQRARVRRTALREEVLAGRDALTVRRFDRWVGGRFMTNERIARSGLRRR